MLSKETESLVTNIRAQLNATKAFIERVPAIDKQKSNYLLERIRFAYEDINKLISERSKKSSNTFDLSDADVEAAANKHIQFIIKEVKAVLAPAEVVSYAVSIENPVDARLRREVTQLNTANTQLSAANTQLSADLNAARAELKTKLAEITDLNNQIGKLTADLTALEAEKKNVDAAIAEEKLNSTKLQDMLDVANAEIATLQSAITAVEKQRDDLNAETKRLVSQTKQLEKENADIKNDNAALQAALKHSQEQVQSITAYLNMVFDNREEIKRDASVLQNNLDIAMRSLSEKTEEMDGLNARILALAAQIRGEMATNRQLQQQIQDLQTNAGSSADIIRQLQTNAGSSADIIRQLQTDNFALQADVSIKDVAISTLDIQLRSSNAKISDLEQQLRELEANRDTLTAEVARATDWWRFANGLYEDAADKLQTADANIARLTGDLATALQQQKILKRLNTRYLKRLRNRNEVRALAAHFVKIINDKKIANIAEMQKYENKITELETELRENSSIAKIRTLRQQMDAANDKIRKLREEIQNQQGDIKRLTAEKVRISGGNNKDARRAKEINDLNEKLDGEKKAADHSRTELVKANAINRNLRAQIQRLTAQIVHNNDAYNRATQKISRENENMKTALRQLGGLYDTLEEEHEAVKLENADYADTCRELMTEIEKLQSQYADNQRIASNEQLEQRMAKLTKKEAELRQRKRALEDDEAAFDQYVADFDRRAAEENARFEAYIRSEESRIKKSAKKANKELDDEFDRKEKQVKDKAAINAQRHNELVAMHAEWRHGRTEREEEKRRTTAEIAALNEELRQIKDELRQLRSQSSSLRSSKSQASSRRPGKPGEESDEERMTRYREERDAYKRERDAAREVITTLKGKIHKLTDGTEAGELLTDVKKKNAEIDRLRATLTQKDGEFAHLNTVIQKKEAEILQLQNSRAPAKAPAEKPDIAALRAELGAIKVRLDQSEEDRKRYKEQRNKMDKENEALKDQLTTLRSAAGPSRKSVGRAAQGARDAEEEKDRALQKLQKELRAATEDLERNKVLSTKDFDRRVQFQVAQETDALYQELQKTKRDMKDLQESFSDIINDSVGELKDELEAALYTIYEIAIQHPEYTFYVTNANSKYFLPKWVKYFTRDGIRLEYVELDSETYEKYKAAMYRAKEIQPKVKNSGIPISRETKENLQKSGIRWFVDPDKEIGGVALRSLVFNLSRLLSKAEARGNALKSKYDEIATDIKNKYIELVRKKLIESGSSEERTKNMLRKLFKQFDTTFERAAIQIQTIQDQQDIIGQYTNTISEQQAEIERQRELIARHPAAIQTKEDIIAAQQVSMTNYADSHKTDIERLESTIAKQKETIEQQWKLIEKLNDQIEPSYEPTTPPASGNKIFSFGTNASSSSKAEADGDIYENNPQVQAIVEEALKKLQEELTKTYAADIAAREETIEHNRAEIARLGLQIEELTQFQQAQAAQQAQPQALPEDQAAYAGQIAAAERLRDLAKLEVERLTQENSAVQEELARTREEHTRELAKLTNTNRDLRGQLMHHKSAYLFRLEQLESEEQILRSQLKNSLATVKKQNETINYMEALQATNEQLVASVAAQTAEMEQFAPAYEFYKTEYENLREVKTEAENQLEDANAQLEAQLGKLRERLAAAEQNASSAKNALHNQKSTPAEQVEAARQLYNKLKSEYDTFKQSSKQQIEDLDKKLKIAEAATAQARSELSRALPKKERINKIQALEADARLREIELQTLKTEHQALETEHDKLLKNLNKSRELILEADKNKPGSSVAMPDTTELDSLRAKVTALEATFESKVAESTAALQANNQELVQTHTAEMQKITEQLAQLTEQLRAAEAGYLANLRRTQETYEAQLSHQQNEFARQMQENADKLAEIIAEKAATEKQMSQVQADNVLIAREIESLKNKNTQYLEHAQKIDTRVRQLESLVANNAQSKELHSKLSEITLLKDSADDTIITTVVDTILITWLSYIRLRDAYMSQIAESAPSMPVPPVPPEQNNRLLQLERLNTQLEKDKRQIGEQLEAELARNKKANSDYFKLSQQFMQQLTTIRQQSSLISQYSSNIRQTLYKLNEVLKTAGITTINPEPYINAKTAEKMFRLLEVCERKFDELKAAVHGYNPRIAELEDELADMRAQLTKAQASDSELYGPEMSGDDLPEPSELYGPEMSGDDSDDLNDSDEEHILMEHVDSGGIHTKGNTKVNRNLDRPIPIEPELARTLSTATGGHENESYTPSIITNFSSVLLIGFGALIIFCILLLIYFLIKQLYESQFKNESTIRNINYHGNRRYRMAYY